jgi:hypothetical protein
MTTGVDGDRTLRANQEGFDRSELRVRRLVDVSAIDMSVTLFGTKWDSPNVLYAMQPAWSSSWTASSQAKMGSRSIGFASVCNTTLVPMETQVWMARVCLPWASCERGRQHFGWPKMNISFVRGMDEQADWSHAAYDNVALGSAFISRCGWTRKRALPRWTTYGVDALGWTWTTGLGDPSADGPRLTGDDENL